MSAVYHATYLSWFVHIRARMPRGRSVAFWRPRHLRFRQTSAGEPWFFKEKGQPHVLGYGRFVESKPTTVQRLWDEFGEDSGSPDIRTLLQEVNEARGAAQPVTLSTEISSVILTDFEAFDPPIGSEEVGLPRLTKAYGYVPDGNPLLYRIDATPTLPEAKMAPASRRELSTEVFERSGANVAYVRGLYGGRCQVSGSPVLSGIGGDLTQIHHIDFLCDGGADHPSNMMSLSPDWHALAHASGTSFDWSTLEFVVAGERFPLMLNKHLKPRPSP